MFEEDDGDEELKFADFVLFAFDEDGNIIESGDSGDAQINMYPVEKIPADPATLASILDFITVETDFVYSDIGEQFSDYLGYMRQDFNLKLKTTVEVAAQGRRLARGNVGIYKNKVKDTLSYGGEQYDGSYTLYFPFCDGMSSYPKVRKENRFDSPMNSSEYATAGNLDGINTFYEVPYNVTYEQDEASALNLKYAKLPGITILNRAELSRQHIYDEYSRMAADIYQTLVSREYVPNIIRKNLDLEVRYFKTSLGEEAPSDLTIDIQSTVTPAMSGDGGDGGMSY